jgi:hypothetical protein
MVSASLQQVLEHLGELRDARIGLPVTSHRRRIGRVIVASKRALRFVLQPLINELLRKQTVFNEEALLVIRTIAFDLKSLQDSALAGQPEIEQRLSRLEKNVERLAARDLGSNGIASNPVKRE